MPKGKPKHKPPTPGWGKNILPPRGAPAPPPTEVGPVPAPWRYEPPDLVYEAPIQDRPPGAGDSTPDDRQGGGGGGGEGTQVLSNALSIIGQQDLDAFLKHGGKKRPKRSRSGTL